MMPRLASLDITVIIDDLQSSQFPDSSVQSSIRDSLNQVDDLTHSLKELGCQTSTIAMNTDLSLFITELKNTEPSLVFNMVQGDGTAHLAGVLSLLDINYVGPTSLSINLCSDKSLSKIMMGAEGVRVPRHWVAFDSSDLSRISPVFPAVVKPLYQDNSVGIDRTSIVYDAPAFVRRTEELMLRFHQPVIVEEFIHGREFRVGMVGNYPETRVLPIHEVLLTNVPAGQRWVYGFDEKWSTGKVAIRPAEISTTLHDQLASASLKAARSLYCRDYSRVDLRVDSDGAVYVLEVNANPDLQVLGGSWPARLPSDPDLTSVVEAILVSATRVNRMNRWDDRV